MNDHPYPAELHRANELIKDYGRACALQTGEQISTLSKLHMFVIDQQAIIARHQDRALEIMETVKAVDGSEQLWEFVHDICMEASDE